MTVEEFKAFAEKNGGMEKAMDAARELKAEGQKVTEDTLLAKMYGNTAAEPHKKAAEYTPLVIPAETQLDYDVTSRRTSRSKNTVPATPLVKFLVCLMPLSLLISFCSPFLSEVTGISSHTIFTAAVVLWIAIIFIIAIVGNISKS